MLPVTQWPPEVNKAPNDGLLVAIFFDLQDKKEYRTNAIQKTSFFILKNNLFVFPDQSSPVTTTKQKREGNEYVSRKSFKKWDQKSLFSLTKICIIIFCGKYAYLIKEKCRLQGK